MRAISFRYQSNEREELVLPKVLLPFHEQGRAGKLGSILQLREPLKENLHAASSGDHHQVPERAISTANAVPDLRGLRGTVHATP